jgi:hypothetical protein
VTPRGAFHNGTLTNGTSNPGAIRLVNNLAWDNAQGNFKFDGPGVSLAIFLNNLSIWVGACNADGTLALGDSTCPSVEGHTRRLRRLKAWGTLSGIRSYNGKGTTPYSDALGALADGGMGQIAIRVRDTVFDNMRPNGIPFGEIVRDLGGAGLFDSGKARMVERAF